eukprot:1539132-Lingulodinium_polyedra.AAC.1
MGGDRMLARGRDIHETGWGGQVPGGRVQHCAVSMHHTQLLHDCQWQCVRTPARFIEDKH